MTGSYFIGAFEVVRATYAALDAFLPAALANVVAQGEDPLPMPASREWPSAEAMRRDASDIPVLAVSSSGLNGTYSRDGEGVFSATWVLRIDYIVRSVSGTYEDTTRDTHRYARAITQVLLERPDLNGFARNVFDLAESYAEADPSASRTLGMGAVDFKVTVDDVARVGVQYTVLDNPVDGAATDFDLTVSRLPQE